MSVFGFVLVALGILVGWAGFKRVSVLDVFKSLLGQGQPVKP